MFKKVRTLPALVGSALLVAGAVANAAVPTDVTDAITASKADVITIGGAVLVVIVAAMTFKWLRKAL